jgi:hypothetical protein
MLIYVDKNLEGERARGESHEISSVEAFGFGLLRRSSRSVI